jgi:PAS domain S-box-containing protein
MTFSTKPQILIVDDYPTNIKVLSDLLIEYGFEVLIARDGENALQKLQRISPDLILLDVLMPGIDGFETCRQLKSQSETRDIPVIFMTALADPVDKIKGLTLGAVDYITKPFQQEEVLARVNTHLKLRHLTRQLEQQNSRLQEEVRSRQIAESALRVSEEKFSKAFRSNPGPMMILTLDEGRVIEINQNFCKILGYPPEQILGRTLSELHLWVHQEDCDRCLATLRDSGTIYRQEYQFYTLAGEIRSLLISAEVIQVRDGLCILAMALDITDCKQAAAELKQAKAAAELANQAKSQFLANISHELRTPLSTILGYTQLMGRDGALNPEQQAHLNIIGRSSEHLLTLINDVLEMTKIESGQLSLNPTDFNLHSLLDALVDMLQPKVQAKGLQLTIERTPDVPTYIRTDATKLRQVLLNLVGNGIKFTEMGQVSLRVALGHPQSGGTAQQPPPSPGEAAPAAAQLSLSFAVVDTGPGIADNEIATLFDPFIQTESGRRSQEGTGLGLPISQRFVELLGGSIEVRSAVGFGSTFSFEIPVERVAAPPSPEAKLPQRVIGLAPGQPSYRLLVAEDQPANRQLLVKLLTAVGFEVRQAENGADAIAQAQSWQPHLIWMDVRMPVIDGYQATQQIKQQATAGSVPKIIALTANAFEEERPAALAAGCDDFLRKPIQEESLFNKMAEHLGIQYVYQASIAAPTLKIPATTSTFSINAASRAELWQLVNGDRDFLADYLNLHLEQMPQLMQDLRAAIAQQNAKALSLSAHTLKGMGLTFGASQFANHCLSIERAAKDGDTAIAPDQLQQLEADLAEVVAAIRVELEGLGAGAVEN